MWVNPEETELVVVVINNSGQERTFDFDLSGFYKTEDLANAYRTSLTENCSSISNLNVLQKGIQYKAPDQTITTFILPVRIMNYDKFSLVKGITFEDDPISVFDGVEVQVKNNPKNLGLNNSKRALVATFGENNQMVVHLEDIFLTLPETQYLHVMTYSTNKNKENIKATKTHDVILLNAGNEWKDQVIDLGLNRELEALTFQSANNNTTIFIDNICINGDSTGREVTDISPNFDFESLQGIPKYTLQNTSGRASFTAIISNTEFVGLNISKNILEYIFPSVTNENVTEDTLVISLTSPLHLSNNTQYLHVMIKSSVTRVNLNVESISEDKTYSNDQWIDLVFDLGSMAGRIVYNLKLSPYGSTNTGSILYLDNICFNDNPSPRKYTYQAPKETSYVIVSRNSGHVLSTGYNSRIIQTKFDSGYLDSNQQWKLEKVTGGYVISNKATGKFITDNNTYHLALNDKTSSLDGQVFTIKQTERGYVKINSVKTGKAFDVEGASNYIGANIGLWDYGTSGDFHRQWAFVEVP